jgi:hypothetical protein
MRKTVAALGEPYLALDLPFKGRLPLLMHRWSDDEWQTLQLGPLWVMSAIIGRSRFDELERQAFTLSVVAAPTGNAALPWQLMQAVDRNADDLFDRLVQDNRSIVSGLGQVTALLESVDERSSRLTREAMLRVGADVARARGPFGRRILEQDAQQLALVAYILESPLETATGRPLDARV